MNSERLKCIMAVLGRYELTLLEKQFVGRMKEYWEKDGMITEQQESILEGINRGKNQIDEDDRPKGRSLYK